MLAAELLRKMNEHDAEVFEEDVHELKANEAAKINNDGIDSQFAYLLTELGNDGLEKLLKEKDKVIA